MDWLGAVSNYDGIILPKYNIVYWIMLVVMGVSVVGIFEYFALDFL